MMVSCARYAQNGTQIAQPQSLPRKINSENERHATAVGSPTTKSSLFEVPIRHSSPPIVSAAVRRSPTRFASFSIPPLTVRDAIPKIQELATAKFATLRLRLSKIAARVVETTSRVRLAFAAACPEADLFRSLPATRAQFYLDKPRSVSAPHALAPTPQGKREFRRFPASRRDREAPPAFRGAVH